MKKVLKTILALGIIGVLAYKAYQYFIRKDDEDVVDGEIIDELGDDAEADEEEKEESLADKIKAAAKKVINKEA